MSITGLAVLVGMAGGCRSNDRAIIGEFGNLRRENIVPVIKSTGWLADAEKIDLQSGAKKPAVNVSEPYNDQLTIVYPEGSKNGLGYFTAEEFAKFIKYEN